jgi:hypothetical protein
MRARILAAKRRYSRRNPVPFRCVSTTRWLFVEWTMGFLMFVVLWCLLLAVAWPIAVVLLLLLPVIWLLSIPFRILGFAVAGVLAFIKALFYLPARLLGAKA